MNFRDSKNESSITTDKKDEPKKTEVDTKKQTQLEDEAYAALESGKITYTEFSTIGNNIFKQED